LWAAAVWKAMGGPEHIRIVELGPGRGTMMSDMLRAVQVMPDFRSAIVVHLVEISPRLQAEQERTLEGMAAPIFWHATLEDVPPGPILIVANEFFDALPVNQAVKISGAWHERRIGIDANGALAFTVSPEPIPLFDRLLPASVRSAPDS